MSDLTGSQSLGWGFSLAYDVNVPAETAKVNLQFEGGTVGSWTLTSTNTSVKVNLTAGGYGVKGSITVNWSSGITYDLTINLGPEKKHYSGPLVSW